MCVVWYLDDFFVVWMLMLEQQTNIERRIYQYDHYIYAYYIMKCIVIDINDMMR
jgi:hypothetical protein